MVLDNVARDGSDDGAASSQRPRLLWSIREDARFFIKMQGGSIRSLFWSQGFWALAIYRFGNWNHIRRPFLIHRFLRIVHSILLKMSEILGGIYLPRDATIGVPFYISHFGCIGVNGGAVIGKRCVIMTGVGIAVNYTGPNKGAAIIGDDVWMSPGCKIVGAVKIGNGVMIGANAVVTKSFPNNVLLVGVPAVIKKQLPKRPASEV